VAELRVGRHCTCWAPRRMLFPKVVVASVDPDTLGSVVSDLGLCGPVFVHLSSEWLKYVGHVGSDAAENEAVLKTTAGAWAKAHCRGADCILGPFPATSRALAGVLLDAGVWRLACPLNTADDAAALETLASELPAERLIAVVRVGSSSAAEASHAMGRLRLELLRSLGGVILDGTSRVTWSDDEGSIFSEEGYRTLREGSRPNQLMVMNIGGVTPEAVGVAHKLHISVIAEAGTRGGSALGVGESLVACCRSDRPDGLFTTVVTDELGIALGLVYSNAESVVAAVRERRGIYWSRSRGGLWRKGDSSGAVQTLVGCRVDCDADALLFRVRQAGAPPSFCHLSTRTCWGHDHSLGELQRTLQERLVSAPTGSYTKRLFDDPGLLRAKLLEEAQELSEASDPDHVAAEAADVMYFALTAAVRGGASLEDIHRHLYWRTLKVKRRPGDAKPERITAAAEFFASRAATSSSSEA
jgi:phosphoribosyl-ATP pyrophosphohydrolase